MCMGTFKNLVMQFDEQDLFLDHAFHITISIMLSCLSDITQNKQNVSA